MRLLDIPTLRFATHLRRLAAAALLLSAVIASISQSARASTTKAVGCADAVPLAAASFSPRPKGEGIAWDARYILDADAAVDFRGGAVPFAIPLLPETTLLPTPGVSALRQGDRITGLCVTPDAVAQGRTIAVTILQPSTPSSTGFGVPVAASNAVQIIETSLGDSRLEVVGPDTLETHVGYVAPRAVSHAAREEARRLTDVRPRVDRSPVYLRGDDVRESTITARIVGPPARRNGTALGAFLLFGSVVGALVVAARKLRRAASIEQADALLAAEIDDVAFEATSEPPPKGQS